MKHRLLSLAIASLLIQTAFAAEHTTSPLPSAPSPSPSESSSAHHEPSGGHDKPTIDPKVAKARGFSFLREMLEDNFKFVQAHEKDAKKANSGLPAFFEDYQHSQEPRVTLVGCSDSRFHLAAIDETPENDVFLVRDIGNQLDTAKGSIEYGINHLHTPVLMFVGHNSCGAIEAAAGDSSGLEPDIQRELAPLKSNFTVREGDHIEEYVEENIHAQVDKALKEFDDKVKDGHLTIIGALYDFKNLKGRGHGTVILLNINGNKDPEFIKNFEKTVQSSKEGPAEIPPQEKEVSLLRKFLERIKGLFAS